MGGGVRVGFLGRRGLDFWFSGESKAKLYFKNNEISPIVPRRLFEPKRGQIVVSFGLVSAKILGCYS